MLGAHLTAHAAVLTVTKTDDSGAGSLRQAILNSNASAGVLDTITFNIPGTGVQTIAPLTALPAITDPVIINGYTQPGSSANTMAVGTNAVLRIEIDGTNAPGAAFIVNSAGGIFKGLVINRFFNASFNPGYAFRLIGAGNTVQGCYLGTNPAGNTDLHNTGGIFVEGGGNNLIGGPSAGARNLILGSSGNYAIEITSGGGNTVQGNYIGTNAAGSAILGVAGIDMLTANNTIGGTAAGAGNVTFSNGGLGISLRESNASGNAIQGNFIGINATGDATLGGSSDGIFLLRAPNNLIGGTVAGAANVISGSTGYAISAAGTDGLIVQGNLIGTNAAGTAAVPNYAGIAFDGNNNTIGGTTPGARNIISGSNPGYGIRFTLVSTTTGNFIQGNYIGTDITGTVALGNAAGGIQVFAFEQPTSVNTIGGTTAGARNIISGNALDGILVLSSNILVQGNYIGTDVTGKADLGNGTIGVNLQGGNNMVGGVAAGAGNVIAFNGKLNNSSQAFSGIYVTTFGTSDAILGNSIFSNGRLGIDLAGGTESASGVTANDVGDADTGSNNLQNYPRIATVTAAGGNITITGSLSSTPSTAFRLEFFANSAADPSHFGEGETFLGFANATTDASGDASYSATFPLAVPIGPITATATDPDNNTSEFSPAFTTELLNISTRLNVLTNDSVLIGGFIVTGSESKKVIVRAIGPSLSPGISGVLADPVLELHEADGSVVINDNWKDIQEAEIIASTIPPSSELESAIVATLAPGAYTAIESGKNGGTGIGLVEVYDLDQSAGATLANISTRGFVNIGANVMIGGFIIGPSDTGSSNILLRAIGPSLSAAGITDPLSDPVLELHDGNGATLTTNDDWKDTQQAAIEATGVPPTDDRESAIVTTLAPGAYTAIVSGKNNTMGVALVEVYHLP